MKAFFIITRTNEMHKHVESFKCINGNSVDVYTYNHVKQDKWLHGDSLDADIHEKAKRSAPDVIVYVGACKSSTPSSKSFVRLKNEIAPTVHFCSDAADEPWWEELIKYDKEGAFSVQVAIDGNRNWPLVDTQITALTPIDPAHYPDPTKPHEKRTIPFGFAGNPGSVSKLKDGRVIGRRPLVAEMITFGLKYRERVRGYCGIDEGTASYKEAAAYMADTRIMPNFAQTGSFEKMHVKGRVVEAGLAGCLLLEPVGSPTPDWFEAGVDYFPYSSMAEARSIVEKYKDRPDETQKFGDRLRRKVLAEHTPEKFWGKVIQRIHDLRSVA